MIYMEDASKRQLLQIALFEDCNIDYKFQAAHELQIRQWQDDMLPQLMSLWGRGYTVFQIAIEMEITENTVRAQLFKYKLYGKRVS